MTGFVLSQLREMARHRLGFILLVTALVLEASYLLVSPLLYKVIFDEGITQGRADTLLEALGVLAALLVIQFFGAVLRGRMAARLGLAVANQLRDQLFTKLQCLPPRSVAERSPGELESLFGADAAAVEQALVRALPIGLLHGLVILVSLFLLLSINWLLFLVTLASLPAAVLLPRLVTRAAETWEARHQKANSAATGFAQETLATLPVIRLFALAAARRREFIRQLDNLTESGPRAYLYGGLVGSLAFLGTGLSQLMVIGAGSTLALRGEMTAGLLVAFVGLLLGISDAVNILTTVLPPLFSAVQARRRLRSFLDQPVPALEDADAQPVPRLSGAIAFEQVGFSYDGMGVALSAVSFTIRPGERVAVVGSSGCGKSTVLALLTRFLAPQHGRVLLDGHPMGAIDEQSLRTNMAVVPQAPVMFETSVAANILVGRPGATMEEVMAAARAAGVHDAIAAKSAGYDTPASTLSGGERQRVAVARALLRDAAILVLDEATSALDPASEKLVNDTVAGLAGHCTIVAVTHRLASITGYDRILVLDRGQLVEQGRHAELLSRGGVYASLWSKQQGMMAEDGIGAALTPERLSLIPFLSDCRPETLEELSRLFVLSHFAEGQTVFRQGDRGDVFYLIARGRFDVTRNDRTVATLRDGDFFGELALLSDLPRAATVTAWSESWCLSLSGQHFLRIIQTEVGLQARIAAAVEAVERAGSV
jgi:ATP-binding cassette subfamily B protein